MDVGVILQRQLTNRACAEGKLTLALCLAMRKKAKEGKTINMNNFTHIIIATIALLAVTLTTRASEGVYRTAITLTNGTQEIFPDTVVTRFNYSRKTENGRTAYFLNVIKEGQTVMTIPTSDIVEINYREMTPYEHFAGDWYLVASPNGEPLPGTSIMVSTAVSIPYHAVLPAPGTPGYGREIYCHIDSMAHRKGLKYDANFKMLYSYDEATQRGSITMVLDDQQPVSATQYTDDASTYAYWDATSTWYSGVSPQHEGGDTGGRHMYFVTHNISTWALEGHELECQWSLADQIDLNHEYAFPTIYEICWVVGLDIPFVQAEHDLIGYIDIFASPRLMRHPWTKPLSE